MPSSEDAGPGKNVPNPRRSGSTSQDSPACRPGWSSVESHPRPPPPPGLRRQTRDPPAHRNSKRRLASRPEVHPALAYALLSQLPSPSFITPAACARRHFSCTLASELEGLPASKAPLVIDWSTHRVVTVRPWLNCGVRRLFGGEGKRTT